MSEHLKFSQIEEDPNVEMIIFGEGRYLMRYMNPDEPRENWAYCQPGYDPKVVYNGGLLPNSLIPTLIYLTLEGIEFPEPTQEMIRSRFTE